jgi:hypothetical protein
MDHFHPETRNLLDRADRAIEESIRLRALNAEVRRQLRLAWFEMEQQLGKPSASTDAAFDR